MRRVLTGLLLLSACGHPATREECEVIVRKNAELELRLRNANVDEETIKKRTAELETARGEDLYKACMGRRVTAKSLVCVEKATTGKEMDACFD